MPDTNQPNLLIFTTKHFKSALLLTFLRNSWHRYGELKTTLSMKILIEKRLNGPFNSIA